MAEQKISDGIMIGLLFTFVIFAFSTIILTFDSSEGVSGVSGELSGFDSESQTNSNNLETELETSNCKSPVLSRVRSAHSFRTVASRCCPCLGFNAVDTR